MRFDQLTLDGIEAEVELRPRSPRTRALVALPVQLGPLVGGRRRKRQNVDQLQFPYEQEMDSNGIEGQAASD